MPEIRLWSSIGSLAGVIVSWVQSREEVVRAMRAPTISRWYFFPPGGFEGYVCSSIADSVLELECQS